MPSLRTIEGKWFSTKNWPRNWFDVGKYSSEFSLLLLNFLDLEYSEAWTHAETLNQQVEKVIIQFKYCINYRNYCTLTWWINF